jgi:hypothetical protein
LHIAPKAIQPKLPRRSVPHFIDSNWGKPPFNIAVLIVKKGTLDAKEGIVMADEAMAMGVARGIKKAGGRLVQKVEITTPNDDNSWADLIVSMHHLASWHEVRKTFGKKPIWLWVHNPGWSSTMRLREEAKTTYQQIFHAGLHLSKRAGFHYLPCGIEDPELFKPSNAPKKWSVSFIANMRLHKEVAPLLKRLQSTMRHVFIAGAEWGYVGVEAAGPIPFNDVGKVLAESKICLDHVSDDHIIEGNSSTRIYQAIACGSPVVSLQKPEAIPAVLRPYVHFANGQDEAYDAIMRIQGNPVERARLRPDKISMKGHSCEDRGKEIWQHIAKKVLG